MAWIADNVTEVTILGQWSNNRRLDNVLHVRREEDNASASARDVLNNWQDHLVDHFANNYTLLGCRYVDHNEAEGATGELLPDPGKPTEGGNESACSAPNLSMLVRKNISGMVGRRAGRLYLPPPCENQVDEDGRILSATITEFTTQLADFFDGLSGASDNELVVVKKENAGTSPVSVVTGLALQTICGTQRRRMRG